MEMVFENMSKQELLQLIYSCETTITKQEKAISKQEKTLSVLEKKEEKLLKEKAQYEQENDYLRRQVASSNEYSSDRKENDLKPTAIN